jgi:hypothetical protein
MTPKGNTEAVLIHVINGIIYTLVDDYYGRNIFIGWMISHGNYLSKRFKNYHKI